MTSRSKQQAGFIAVEVLVGLAITAFVLTAAMQLTLRLFHSDRTAAALQAEEDGVWRAHSLLRQSLEHLIVLPEKIRAVETLSGTAGSLSILTTGPAALAAREPLHMSFAITHRSDEAELRVSWRLLSRSDDQSDSVLRGARRIAFAYRAKGSGGDWVDEWTNLAELPALVKLTIEGEKLPSTEVVVPVHAGISELCIANPMVEVCQP
jgi:type II secretory pathway component PulJ